MRLLTEYMSVPEVTGAVATSKALIKNSPERIKDNSDNVENRNIQLARQQEEHKSRLVDVLSRFPFTALWLMTRYEHGSGKDEQDDETNTATTSDFDNYLNLIKKHYNQASQSARLGKLTLEETNNLKLGLQQFPFAFDDLPKLVDLMIHSAKVRGITLDLNYLASIEAVLGQGKKLAAVVSARFQKSSGGDVGDVKRDLNGNDELSLSDDFLFLPAEKMGHLLIDAIAAEHYWLSFRQQLASANYKLVLFIANQYKGSFLDFEDLVQEGHSGLLKAVDRFKYRLGFQFSTYAGYWIRQAISRALSRSERVVRIPCGQIATINRMFRAKDELTLKTGKEPDAQQIAQYAQLTLDEVNNLLSISQSSVPLEANEDEDDDHNFAPIDFLEQRVFRHSYSMIAESQLAGLVKSAIETLNAREAKILCSHFGIGNDQQKTLQEIGEELNLTRERVRQIQVVALNKIKMRYGDQLLSFL